MSKDSALSSTQIAKQLSLAKGSDQSVVDLLKAVAVACRADRKYAGESLLDAVLDHAIKQGNGYYETIPPRGFWAKRFRISKSEEHLAAAREALGILVSQSPEFASKTRTRINTELAKASMNSSDHDAHDGSPNVRTTSETLKHLLPLSGKVWDDETISRLGWAYAAECRDPQPDMFEDSFTWYRDLVVDLLERRSRLEPDAKADAALFGTYEKDEDRFTGLEEAVAKGIQSGYVSHKSSLTSAVGLLDAIAPHHRPSEALFDIFARWIGRHGMFGVEALGTIIKHYPEYATDDVALLLGKTSGWNCEQDEKVDEVRALFSSINPSAEFVLKEPGTARTEAAARLLASASRKGRPPRISAG